MVHATFTIERTYPVPPSRVFRAFATLSEKLVWADEPDWKADGGTDFDFRVGGHERFGYIAPTGKVYR